MYEEKENIFLNKFNWGAFFAAPIWGIFNRSYFPYLFALFLPVVWFILGFVAAVFHFFFSGAGFAPLNLFPLKIFIFILYLIFGIYCARRADKDAYNNVKWNSVDEFNQVQRNWSWLGAVIFIFLTFGFFYEEIDSVLFDANQNVNMLNKDNPYRIRKFEKLACIQTKENIENTIRQSSFISKTTKEKVDSLNSSVVRALTAEHTYYLGYDRKTDKTFGSVEMINKYSECTITIDDKNNVIMKMKYKK